MGRRDREKASDVFLKSNSFFSRKACFSDAFPEIAELKVEYEEIGDGIKFSYSRRLDANSVGEYINCSNPMCYNGGFSLGSILREMVRNRENHKVVGTMCQGYEGSHKGRVKYRSCLNHF